MANIVQNLGKIVPNHRGSFKPDVQYRVMDEVFYFGASYRAVELPPLGTIPTNEDYWVIVSESSARLTDVDVVDTSVDGEVTIKFTYEDLTTYEVTTGPLMPALVNPDWEATSGPTQILNKPSLGNAAYASIGDTPGSVSAGDHRHDNATTSVDGFLSAADKTKLNGIAAGATANNTNSYLLDRGNHTNTQSMSTIDGLISALNAKLNSSTAGAPSGVATLDVNGRLPVLQGGGQPIIQLDISSGDLTPSGFNTALGHVGFYKIANTVGSPITYPATWISDGLGGYGTVEGYNYNANDYVYSYQIASSNTGNKWMRRATSSTTWGPWVEQVSVSVATTSANGLMSAADKVKLNGVAAGATANNTDAHLLNRTNHTGSQAISTVSGLQAALDAKSASLDSVSFIELGSSISAPATAYFDFHSIGTPASDYEARIVREAGANGNFSLINTGTGNLAISTPGRIRANCSDLFMDSNSILQFADGNVDKIKYFGNTMGVGIEPNSLTHWSAQLHRWKTGATSSSNGTTRMELSTTALSVTGNITATGDIEAYSDEQLKSNIETIDSALDKVSNLRGVYYTKDDKRGMGVIAQEVKEVLPEVVGTSGEYLTVAYGNIVGVLIEAIKELKAEVEILKRCK